MMVNGQKTKCKELVSMNGQMAEGIKDNISKIKSMVLVYMNGQMEDSTKVTGQTGNSMVLENIQTQMALLKLEFGRMVFV